MDKLNSEGVTILFSVRKMHSKGGWCRPEITLICEIDYSMARRPSIVSLRKTKCPCVGGSIGVLWLGGWK